MNDTTELKKSQGVRLAEMAEMEEYFLLPSQVAPLLGCQPYAVSLMAETEEGRKALGFPVIRLGTRTKIPRIPFLRFMGWEGEIRGAME